MGSQCCACPLRVISLVVAAVAGVLAAIAIADRPQVVNDWIVQVIVFALAATVFVFAMWHPICTKTHIHRARDLGRYAGLTDVGYAQLEQIYGDTAGRGFEVMPISAKTANVHEYISAASG